MVRQSPFQLRESSSLGPDKWMGPSKVSGPAGIHALVLVLADSVLI